MFNLLKKMFPKPKISEDDTELSKPQTLKIWGVLEGPFSAEEVEDPNLPEGLEWMLLCKAELDGEVFHKEYWFSTLEDAHRWLVYFQKNIEPMEIQIRDE